MTLHLGSNKNLKINIDGMKWSLQMPTDLPPAFAVLVDGVKVGSVLAKIDNNAPVYDNKVEVI